jgi:hypothetical protein
MRREQVPRAAVGRNGGQALVVAARVRRARRHRHHSGFEAGKKCDDELEPGRICEQYVAARLDTSAQCMRQGRGMAAQCLEAQDTRFVLAVGEEGV